MNKPWKNWTRCLEQNNDCLGVKIQQIKNLETSAEETDEILMISCQGLESRHCK